MIMKNTVGSAKCARYNRPDSREDMEQDLHERMIHTKIRVNMTGIVQVRKMLGEILIVHRIKKSSYSYQNENNSKWTGEKKKRKTPVAAIVIIIVVAIVIAAGSSIFSIVRNEIRDQITDGWDTDYDNWAQEEEQIEPEYQNRIYVEYAWSDYVGPNMSDINWDDYYVNVSTTERAELEQLTAPEGYVYYIVSLVIKNNLSDTYNLSNVSEEDVSVWSEDEDREQETYYKVDKVFEISYPETESGDSNYVDILIAVPKDVEQLYGSCMLNGKCRRF